jgi:hypothetical protein
MTRAGDVNMEPTSTDLGYDAVGIEYVVEVVADAVVGVEWAVVAERQLLALLSVVPIG